MPSKGFFSELIKFIATILTSKDVMFTAREELANLWARIFAARNVLILGAKQTGKTSLHCFGCGSPL